MPVFELPPKPSVSIIDQTYSAESAGNIYFFRNLSFRGLSTDDMSATLTLNEDSRESLLKLNGSLANFAKRQQSGNFFPNTEEIRNKTSQEILALMSISLESFLGLNPKNSLKNGSRPDGSQWLLQENLEALSELLTFRIDHNDPNSGFPLSLRSKALAALAYYGTSSVTGSGYESKVLSDLSEAFNQCQIEMHKLDKSNTALPALLEWKKKLGEAISEIAPNSPALWIVNYNSSFEIHEKLSQLNDEGLLRISEQMLLSTPLPNTTLVYRELASRIFELHANISDSTSALHMKRILEDSIFLTKHFSYLDAVREAIVKAADLAAHRANYNSDQGKEFNQIALSLADMIDRKDLTDAQNKITSSIVEQGTLLGLNFKSFGQFFSSDLSEVLKGKKEIDAVFFHHCPHIESEFSAWEKILNSPTSKDIAVVAVFLGSTSEWVEYKQNPENPEIPAKMIFGIAPQSSTFRAVPTVFKWVANESGSFTFVDYNARGEYSLDQLKSVSSSIAKKQE